MSLSLVPFIVIYFLIINSVIGYGYLTIKLSNLENKYLGYGYLGLCGVFFLIFLSYFTHFFIAHNYIHNSIVLVVGLFFFIYYYSKDKEKIKIIKLNIFFLILFISILIYKSHDDFSYYHFPYIYHLTQNNLFLGIGNFNHGFRTQSSIFYLNSLFYLPFFKYFLFQVGAALIMGFSCFSILELIQKKILDKNYDRIFYLTLFSFIFILIFFYRIAEHGSDRSAQILVFLLIIELFLVINFFDYAKENFSKILIILSLIISLKAFYILYLIFVTPIIYYFIKKKKIKLFFLIFKNPLFYLSILIFNFVLMTNFFNTGCVIYPVSFSCLDIYSWSIPLSEVHLMNDWYEQWSKAGAGPNFRVDNPEQYIQNFNWLSNWIDKYFFTKVSDFIFGILLVIIILFFLFYSESKQNIKYYIGEKFIYILLIILFMEWFYNHPSLRYGGYSLLCLLFFLPASYLLGTKLPNGKIQIKTYTLIFLTLLIFFSRNIDRIINENQKYNYNPFEDISYKVDESYFTIQERFKNIIRICNEKKMDCVNNIEISLKNKNGIKIFYKNKP